MYSYHILVWMTSCFTYTEYIYMYVVYGVNVIEYGWESSVFHAHSPLMKDCIIKKKKQKNNNNNNTHTHTKKKKKRKIKLSYYLHALIIISITVSSECLPMVSCVCYRVKIDLV